MPDPSSLLSIRAAVADDAAAIAAIYAHHVLHGTGTFEEVPPAIDEMAARLDTVLARGWPWLVAEDASGVIGYAYAAQFRDRAAYRFLAEDALYLRADRIGQGIGRALLAALLTASVAAGFRRMVAVIGDAANAGSIGVHAALGFTSAGTLSRAGYKFDRWLDVVFMERELGETA